MSLLESSPKIQSRIYQLARRNIPEGSSLSNLLVMLEKFLMVARPIPKPLPAENNRKHVLGSDKQH
jgi:hypothetical protein